MIERGDEEFQVTYQLKELTQPQYDAFNKNKELATLLQSYNWGQIKSTWEQLHFGVFDDSNLTGTLLILKKRLPLGRSMLYIPKGPVMEFEPMAIQQVTKQLKEIGRREKAVFIKMDPPILRRSFSLEEAQEAPLINQEIQQQLIQAGFEQGPLTLNLHDTIQPRFQAVVQAEGFGLAAITKKGRQGIQTAQKRGVIIEKHGVESLPIFAQLMEKTAQRQGISLRGEVYFNRLLTTYPAAFLMLGKIDPAKRQAAVLNQLQELTAELADLPENQVKKRKKLLETQASLTKESERLASEIAEHGTEPIYISGTLSVPYGQTSELLYAGMDDAFKHYMPAYYTWFASIEEAFSLGYRYCNLGGIDGHLNDGLIGFKKNFQPVIQEFMGEFDLPTTNRFFYRIIKKAYEIRTKK